MSEVTPLDHLNRAVELLHGQSQLASAATECGPKRVDQRQVWNWLHRDGRVSGDYVIQVSKATRYQVTPHELRPDLYPNETDGIPKGRRSKNKPQH